MNKTFVFYESFHVAISSLPDKSQLKLYKAITAHSFGGDIPKLNKMEEAMLVLILPQIDASKNRYNACVENGKKGGRPKTKKEPNISEENTPLVIENENQSVIENENQLVIENKNQTDNVWLNQEKTLSQNPNKNDNDNDNVNVNDNDNDNDNDNGAGFCCSRSSSDNFSEIFTLYESALGKPVTPHNTELLQELLKEHGKSRLLSAINNASKQGKMQIAYIEGILRNWDNGVTGKDFKSKKPPINVDIEGMYEV